MNNILTAQELKTKGAQILKEKTKQSKEAIVTVRGKNAFVVLTMDQYDYLRGCELDTALAETERDLAEGKFVIQSIEEHMKTLENV